MTLREILAIEPVKGLEVLNSYADLDRVVSTVESTETPDVNMYVAKNSFIITTGMVYKDDQSKLCELILRLNDLPCAGLGIKLGRFVEKLDPCVLKVADSIGFPLIRIPMNVTLGNVYHSILAIIWDTRNKQLIEVLNTQRKYYDLIIQGTTLRHLINIIGTSNRRHIQIFDRLGTVLVSHKVTPEEAKLVKNWIEITNFNDSGCMTNDMCKNEMSQVTFYPIKSVTRNMYYMAVFGMEKGQDSFMMDEIILIIGMFFYKELFVKHNAIQLRYEFLKALLKQEKYENWTEMQILNMGRYYGLRKGKCYRIVAGRFSGGNDRKFDSVQMTWREERFIMTHEYLKKTLEHASDANIIVLPDEDNWGIILLIQGETEITSKHIRDVRHVLFKTFGESFTFASGNLVSNLDMLSDSYWQAMEMLDKYKESDNIAELLQYQPKDIVDILKNVSERHIREVCNKMLGVLAFPKDSMNLELRMTLKVYLNNYCSITQTANALFIHRNTVRYRIKLCEEKLGVNLSDQGVCFRLQLCIYMADML